MFEVDPWRQPAQPSTAIPEEGWTKARDGRHSVVTRPVAGSMVVAQTGHAVVEGQTTRAGAATWHGLVFCSCGWAGGVADCARRSEAEEGLREAWAVHSRSGGQ